MLCKGHPCVNLDTRIVPRKHGPVSTSALYEPRSCLAPTPARHHCSARGFLVNATPQASQINQKGPPTPPASPESPHALSEQMAAAATARAKLALLSQLEKRSKSTGQSLSAYASGAPRMIDARMYTATLQAQRKLSEKLSDANVYAAYLEDKINGYNEDLQAAAEIFKKVNMEFGTTGRLAEAAVAAVRFGVDKEDSIVKITKLRERLEALEKAMKKEREMFSKRVPRAVPVTWVGSASEVRLVGDFDGWTRGLDLGTPDAESDGVLRTFEATVQLLPGKYRVKFMVDGEWRLAPEWPMENNEVGETNNVLEVK